MPIPRSSGLIIIRYDDFDATLRDAHALMSGGPASIEAVDSTVLGLAQRDGIWNSVREFFPLSDSRPIRGANIVEFIGDSEDVVTAQLDALAAMLDATQGQAARLGYSIARGGDVQAVWKMRKRAAGMLGNLPGEKRPITFVEDTAVPPENLADYIGEFRDLLDSHGLQYGMFGHVDAGVLHVRPAIDMKDAQQARLIREITDEIARLTRKYGGVLWGEHGKGLRSEYAPSFFGTLYPQVQAVKAAFDRNNQLNPGKVATPGEQVLTRLDTVPTRGESVRRVPVEVRTGYAEAVFCNGNGTCYNFDPDDAMCPSWKGTRERRHSPKGRATITREWLRRLSNAGADPVAEAQRLRAGSGWRTLPARVSNTLFRSRPEHDFSHLVKEAMDGCLACKSCVTGCPIKVDVPSFRAKFLEIYHGRYLRPLKDHLVGSLEQMLPLVARMPEAYNRAVGNKVGAAVLRWVGLTDTPLLSGIDLAKELARRGLEIATPEVLARLDAGTKAKAVVLVQDAFTSHYETGLVLDVADLLAALGYRAFLAPYAPNGKALHVHGFLGKFQRMAASNAAGLRALAASGVELVGIDPSVTLTFRSEYREALGQQQVPEVLLLQEWLAKREVGPWVVTGSVPQGSVPQGSVPQGSAPQGSVPQGSVPQASDSQAHTSRRYRFLPHCTERALAASGVEEWKAVFTRFGLTLEVLASGCCGMAGTYGHEVRHQATSARIYDLSWRKHVETDTTETLVASGYSCRSQVKRMGGGKLLHPAQALLAAVRAQAR